MTGNTAPLRLQFTCPETAQAGSTLLAPLLNAVASGDAASLAAIRATAAEPENFDRFAAALQRLVAGAPAAAAEQFDAVTPGPWRLAAEVFRALAVAGGGDLRQAYAILNRVRDGLEADRLALAPTFMADRNLIAAALRAIVTAEQGFPPAGPVRLPLFRHLISYPRSGSGALRMFLSFAFGAPRYSVYPGDGCYFSRRFHDRAPGHAVFVKDHGWHDEYARDDSLALVRDGRNVVLSFARFLFVQGATQLVRRGQLADFIDSTARNKPFGFWGDHTRRLLAARESGARLEILRYEDIIGNFAQLCALAQRLAGGAYALCEDEAQYRALTAQQRRSLAERWGESAALPTDSFIPQDWSVGGGANRWQDSFDAPAARRFHELGGTELLLRLGHETDEAWWRQF